MDEKVFNSLEKMYVDLSGKIDNINGEIKEIRIDINGLKQGVNEVRQDIVEIKQDIIRIEHKMDDNHKALYDGFKLNAEGIQELNIKVDNLTEGVEHQEIKLQGQNNYLI